MSQIAIQILGIFAMIAIGAFAARRHWFPADFSTHLSTLLIRVFYPSLLFSAILRKYTFSAILENWILPVGAAAIVAVGWSVGWGITRFFNDRVPLPTRRAFHFSCALNNYSFLPIMLIAGMPLGEKGVAMVALTTIASDTLMWTLGFCTLTGESVSPRTLPGLLLKPPVFALFSAILILFICACFNFDPAGFQEIPLTKTALNVLYTYLGNATIPASALVCGMRLGQLKVSGIFSPLQMAVTALRMILIPAVILILLIFLPLQPDVRAVLSVIALMPGAMAGVSIAEVYGGDVSFISAQILNTHLLCILTVPLGLYLLSLFT